MIPRYCLPEMARLFSDENKYATWLKVEFAAAQAMAEQGLIPADAAAAMCAKKPAINPVRIGEIEKEVKHDVIAFLTHIGELIGPDARYLHHGLTSSDVLDTSLGLLLCEACDLVVAELQGLRDVLEKSAKRYASCICIGRSHGIHAEPTSFGLKLAGYYAECTRNLERLGAARKEVSTMALSGAVGTYAHVGPAIEARAAQLLGLSPEPVSTQVIPRDRHAFFFATLGVVASSLERLATEIRHLQRSEVREAEEAFQAGQKGSSAMPHKRNPVLSENVTGLARLVRSCVLPAMENVALWHERDISHSSVERGIVPDALSHLHFALHRMRAVMENLLVYPDAMRRNLDLLGGLIFSQKTMLALVDAGMPRIEAYKIVQEHAMHVWRAEPPRHGLFARLLAADKRIAQFLDKRQLDALFDEKAYLKHIDDIFERLFSRDSPPTGHG